MRPKVGVMTLFGANPEPFLVPSLESVEWADYVCAINTARRHPQARANEEVVRSVVPPERLRIGGYEEPDGGLDFAFVRNLALELADPGDYVLLVDADMVHWPELEEHVRTAIAEGWEVGAALFWHHCVYKNLWHSTPHREILFRNDGKLHWSNTEGTMHEMPSTTRPDPPLFDGYYFHHYGYIRPARELHDKWEFYESLGARVHDWDRSQPDHALDDWPRVCQIFTGEHPPAVRGVLENYPTAPRDIFKGRNPHDGIVPRVGLVLLTWDDEKNLRRCLHTLRYTTEPFKLYAVDNGSTDGTKQLLAGWMLHPQPQGAGFTFQPSSNLSLTEALNVGFGHFLGDESIDYIGWIHPDHSFEWPFWLTELRQAMDDHPEFAKLGATVAGEPQELRPGNSQCYLVRRTALEQVGLFDEGFQACGGFEDWEHNYRLLQVGKVMIWPGAVVRHEAMSTRRRHDNYEAAMQNGDLYYRLTGSREAFV